MAPPAKPIFAASANGSYAIAVPAFGNQVALGPRSVAWTLEDEDDERVFGIGQATGAGAITRPLTLTAKRRSGIWGFAGSRLRLAAFISPSSATGAGRIWTGPRDGVVRPFVSEHERLRATRTCRRRVGTFGERGGSQAISLSGERIAYSRSVTCRSARRRAGWQLVIRNLRTGRTRVMRRFPVGDVQLAGDFLAFRREARRDDRRIYVVRASTGKVVYRASLASVVKESTATHYSLGADGTLAVAYFPGLSDTGRLAWLSPAQPRIHKLGRVSVWSGPPLNYANGRIAYVRRYATGSDQLAVTDLKGATSTVATFTGEEQLDAFDLDGSRITFAHSRYRSDRGRPDDGLPSQCWGDKIRVQERAAIVEVHPVVEAARLGDAQLPTAAPYRSAVNTRDECPYRD